MGPAINNISDLLLVQLVCFSSTSKLNSVLSNSSKNLSWDQLKRNGHIWLRGFSFHLHQLNPLRTHGILKKLMWYLSDVSEEQNCGNSLLHPSSHAPVIFEQFKKIVKHYEKIWKKLVTHTYEFFTLVQNFGMKWQFLCSVQKRQNQCFQICVFRSHSDNCICLFCTERRNCHFIPKFFTSMGNSYMYVTNFFQIFL